ncbi:hypothetical protein CVT26_008929, partial [Gymnopilus dilepis]
ESIQLVAKVNGTELDLQDDISIESVTKAAFRELGNKGILQSGLNHSCSQCSQPHKAMADRVDNDDPASVAGADDNHGVPELIEDNAQESAEDTARARQEAQQRRADIEAHRSQQDEAMDVDDTPANPPANAPVNMPQVWGHGEGERIWGHSEGKRSEPEPNDVRVHLRRNETSPQGGSPKTVSEATSLHDADGKRRSYQPAVRLAINLVSDRLSRW